MNRKGVVLFIFFLIVSSCKNDTNQEKLSYLIEYRGHNKSFDLLIKSNVDTVYLTNNDITKKLNIDRQNIKEIKGMIESKLTLNSLLQERIKVFHGGFIKFSMNNGNRRLTAVYSNTAALSLLPYELKKMIFDNLN
jgi:hypothetical protein